MIPAPVPRPAEEIPAVPEADLVSDKRKHNSLNTSENAIGRAGEVIDALMAAGIWNPGEAA